MTFSFDILERNLAALRLRQPEVAALIESSDLPDGLTPALGRDGTPTFLLPGEDGPMWLGGSSMPRASAEEMFGQVDPRGGSVTLPAMLTGMEAIVLAERVKRRFAVFVVDHAAIFKTALALHDYQWDFDDGRIVLLLLDDLVGRSREFFSRNPGYAVPTSLLKVPQLHAGELTNLTRVLEDAGAAAIEVQNQCLLEKVKRLQSRNMSIISAVSPVALIGLDDSAETVEPAGRIKEGLEGIDANYSLWLPLRPEQFHVAARLGEVLSFGAEWVIYLNGVSHHERALLPSALPVVQWSAASCSVQYGASIGPSDALVVSSQTDCEGAHSCGWPADQIIRLEPSAGRPVGGGEVGPISQASPILLLMDLPDDRPEAAGVTLPSQIALWQEIQQQVKRRGDRYRAEDASQILRAAQHSSGTQLTDSALLALFESWLRTRIAPAVVAREVARTLIRSGFKPQIWGHHWSAIGRGEDLRRGPFPAGNLRPAFFDIPAWTVIPWFSRDAVQIAVDALACGNVVLMRGAAADWIAQYPDLHHLADGIQWFGGSRDIASSLREAKARHHDLSQSARAIATKIHSEHRMCHRLRALINFIRNRQMERQERDMHVERV